MNYADTPREEIFANVIPMLREAARAAAEHGVTLALENHIDFTSADMLHILETVDSEHLRVNFDTGNTIRLFEDPAVAAARLAPYTVSTHTKDIATRVRGGSPAENFAWWPSCPIGEGVIDMPAVIAALHDGGFDGCLAVEIDLVGEQWLDQGEEQIVSTSVERLREMIPSPAAA
jgi:3-oxoisoapionate decarboxylase